MKKSKTKKLINKINFDGKKKANHSRLQHTQRITAEDIKNIRLKLNQSQAQFAYMINVKISTLQNWEQGRRQPKGPAMAFLKVISKNPTAVLEALHT